MKKNCLFISIILFLLFANIVWADEKFDKELALSIKVGKGNLSNEEKQKLVKENHPIVMQMNIPATFKMLEMFANLPDKAHTELLKNTYLKWKFKDLDQKKQKVYEEIIKLNIDMMKQQGIQPQAGFSIDGLKKAEVGFAVIELPSSKQKVVSWYILWSNISEPTWVTIVNGWAVGTQEYYQVHMKRLPSLKNMPLSNNI